MPSAKKFRTRSQLSPITGENMKPIVNVLRQFGHVLTFLEFLQSAQSTKFNSIGAALILIEQAAPEFEAIAELAT